MPGRVVKLAAAVDAVGLRDCCLIQRRQSGAIDQSGIIASDSQYCTATLGGIGKEGWGRANLGMEVIESGLWIVRIAHLTALLKRFQSGSLSSLFASAL